MLAARWLAAGFGSGWLPRAPGTWGSLAALVPGAWLLAACGQMALAWAALVASLLGCLACAQLAPADPEGGGEAGAEAFDPGWIVIDEWAGLWLCLLVASFSGVTGWALWVPAFVGFRLFDILKPWPVSLCERHGPVWWRIMADDLMAGLLGGVSGGLAAAGLAAALAEQ